LSVSSSKIRDISFKLLTSFDIIVQPRIKHSLIKWFWNKFFLSHAKLAVMTENEETLKQILREGYNELKPIFEQEQMGLELRESQKKYNSIKPPNLGSIKDALELVPDAGL